MFQVIHMNTEHIFNPPTISREIVYIERKTNRQFNEHRALNYYVHGRLNETVPYDRIDEREKEKYTR